MDIKDPELAAKVAEWQDDRAQKTFERRYVDEIEMRMDFEDQKKPKIVGYAAVFNKRTQLWGSVFEQVAPGAFKNTIEKDDVRALWNHNPDYVLGRTRSGTLALSEDEKGLRYEIIPPDTSWAKDLQVLIKRKDISQSSFGFNIVKESVQKEKEGKQVLRTLEEVRLFDVSPVTFPAYKQTEVHVRMIAGQNETAYLFEDSGNVIVVPDKVDIAMPEAALSDEEMFREFDAILGKVFK